MTPGGVCPECFGKTINFKGPGLDSEYRVCPRYQEPGHLNAAEIREAYMAYGRAVYPSGRFA